jgi:hypothetical protein
VKGAAALSDEDHHDVAVDAKSLAVVHMEKEAASFSDRVASRCVAQNRPQYSRAEFDHD